MAAVLRILDAVAELPKPAAVRGFEGIQRYWDPLRRVWTAKVLPGETYVTREAEAVSTVVGSCVAACIRDPLTGIGGMNHFLLPREQETGQRTGSRSGNPPSGRYGTQAMRSLIRDLLQLGARRDRLEVKLFGGARILPAMTDVGASNVAFARAFLEQEGLGPPTEDVGGRDSRQVLYFPATGCVELKRMRSSP